jgi:WD40 repeat protein
LATAEGHEISLWPLAGPRAAVVDGWFSQGFTPDGRYLVTTEWDNEQSRDTRVRLWPVPGNDRDDAIDLVFPPDNSDAHIVVSDPDGRRLLAMDYAQNVVLFSVSGEEEARNEFGFPATDQLAFGGDFSPSGRLVAAAVNTSDKQPTLRVWDLQTDEVRVYNLPGDPVGLEGQFVWSLAFADETTIYTSGGNGLLRWDLEVGSFEKLMPPPAGGRLRMKISSDRRTMLTYEEGSQFDRLPGSAKLHDLRTGQVRSLEIPGRGYLGMSPDAAVWVSGDLDGSVWVGRMDGGEAHLLCGHTKGLLWEPSISPDLRWIVSSGVEDISFTLWPMPDLDKPPLHTLPHDKLVAKLHSLTNLRAVRDEESSTGWKIEVGPFPGWETVPTW